MRELERWYPWVPLKEIFHPGGGPLFTTGRGPFMPRFVLPSIHLDLGLLVAAVVLLAMVVTGLLVEH